MKVTTIRVQITIVCHRLSLALVAVVLACAPASAGSSNSLMDLKPDGSLLLVANADNGSLSVVDAVNHSLLRAIKVGEKPEGVAWIGEGPLALATVYREDHLVVVDAERGKVVHRLAVADEPYGVVTDSAGRRAWVTHEYPGLVSEFDLTPLASGKPPLPVRTIAVTPFIRGLALSADQRSLFITGWHNGVLYQFDLASGKVVDEWRGQTRDNLARNVELHPRRPKAYVPHIRSRIATADGAGSIFPQLSVIDLVPPIEGKRRKSIGMDTFNNLTPPTSTPWRHTVTASSSPSAPMPQAWASSVQRPNAARRSSLARRPAVRPATADHTLRTAEWRSPYLLHDVGTGDDDPTEKMGPRYDTPTLLGVYRQTAYLHHGKAKSLAEVLTTFNKGDRHGKTSHLTAEQVADLIEFLKSLPYKPPPGKTHNTID